MKGKKDILSVIRKILKNEYLTYFVGFFTILFVMEILNSPSNNLIKLLRYTLNYKIVLVLVVLGIVFIGYFNIPLSLLLLTNLLFLMNIKFKVETFANRIPDLVDKNTLISYQKNFGDMKKAAKKEETEKNIKNKINSEKIKREKELEAKNKAEEKEIENKKEEIENKKVIGYYDKELNVKNTERLDLDSEDKGDKSDKGDKRHKKSNKYKSNYDIKSELKKAKQEQEEEKNDNTLEEELVKKNYEIKRDLEVLEEDESSESSESSDSSDSSESSDSSDSEGMDDVSMDEAREHVMKKIRNKIKKKYVSKKKYD